MSKIRLIGLDSIAIGPVGATGIMGTELMTIVAIVPDSAHLVIEPPGVTDLFVEDEDLPDIQILSGKKMTIEFATRDMGTSIFYEAFAGAASTLVWSMSTAGSVQIQERCLKAISKSYAGQAMTIEVRRASVHAGADLRFTKTESGQINFSCDVLIPATSLKVAPVMITIA